MRFRPLCFVLLAACSADAPEGAGPDAGAAVDGGPRPTLLAEGQGDPRALAVDGDHVYWVNTSSGEIMRVPRQGGRPEAIAQGQHTPWVLALDESHVYWGTFSAGALGGVLRAPKAGGPVQYLTVASGIQGLVVDIERVYFTDEAHLGLVSARKDGSSPQQLHHYHDQLFVAGALVSDGSLLYFPDGDRILRLVKSPGNAPVVLGDAESVPAGLALDGANVYWANQGTGELRKSPRQGGAPSTLATDQPGAAFVAVDASRVYWTNPDSGRVLAVDKTGGPIEILASGQSSPQGLAVDDEAIYWASGFDGAIWRLEKE
jgi:DNA-binding beta-propeller fold protein YncE